MDSLEVKSRIKSLMIFMEIYLSESNLMPVFYHVTMEAFSTLDRLTSNDCCSSCIYEELMYARSVFESLSSSIKEEYAEHIFFANDVCADLDVIMAGISSSGADTSSCANDLEKEAIDKDYEYELIRLMQCN